MDKKISVKLASLGFLLILLVQLVSPVIYSRNVSANELEVESNSLRIHFEGGERNYDELSLWLYGDVATWSEEVDSWPNGSPFSTQQMTSFGPYMDVELNENADTVNLIAIYQGESITDDLSISLLSQEVNEVWVMETGEVSLYEPIDLPENRVRIHWYLEDSEYEPWGLWLWGDAAETSEQRDSWPIGAVPFSSTQVGRYGAYVDIEMNDNPNILNFLFANRDDAEDQFGEYSYSDFRNHNQLFLRERDHRIYTNPYYIAQGQQLETEAVIPDWTHDSVLYEVNIRQYTEEGTFEAFSEHLPRLKRLGVDILWFMPIHPISETGRNGTLGSYYAVSDYTAINPEFGTMEDFISLVKEAQEMGFYVVLDWVANHTGWDHHWIETNPEFYEQDSNGNIVYPQEFGWTDVAQLNYENQQLRSEMEEAMRFWVSEIGIDGFRADYASGVPTDFWESVSYDLNQIKPLFMLAEDNRAYNLLNQAFFVNWGWDFHHIMNDLALESRNKNDVIRHFERYPELYPQGTYPMQFIDSHDENSWEGTIEERLGVAANTMAALYFTVPGIPMIYSGQEAGLNERLAFFDKDEIDWSDLSLQQYYQQLIALKKNNEALWNGNAGGKITFLETSSDELLAFERTLNDNTVIVMMNLSGSDLEDYVYSNELAGEYSQAFEFDTYELEATQLISLEPWEYIILTKGSVERFVIEGEEVPDEDLDEDPDGDVEQDEDTNEDPDEEVEQDEDTNEDPDEEVEQDEDTNEDPDEEVEQDEDTNEDPDEEVEQDEDMNEDPDENVEQDEDTNENLDGESDSDPEEKLPSTATALWTVGAVGSLSVLTGAAVKLFKKKK